MKFPFATVALKGNNIFFGISFLPFYVDLNLGLIDENAKKYYFFYLKKASFISFMLKVKLFVFIISTINFHQNERIFMSC